jgi:hypothetical protein
VLGLTPDPITLFGGLLGRCIRDSFAKERSVLLEDGIFLIVGAFSSFATVYLLSLAGVFV